MKSNKTDKNEQLRVADQLCFALYATSRSFTKQYAKLLAEMKITYPQYIALMVLWENDGLLVSELAAEMEVDSATITPLVQRLEKLELVKRVRSSQDERRVLIFLTDKGKGYFDKALSIPDALGCAVGVTVEEAGELVKKLKNIRDFIKTNEA